MMVANMLFRFGDIDVSFFEVRSFFNKPLQLNP